METKLKIPFAFRDGHLIHISEVESGTRHGGLCPACEQPLIARKGMKMRHHFAHRPDVQCNPETVLHRIAKVLLCAEIEKALMTGREMPVSWKCSRCSDQHQGNLLRKARSVRLEHSLGECRPDLTLFDEHVQPIVTIEIVVSHAPEDAVREFCERHRIGLLEYHVKTGADLESLRNLSQFRATTGSVCLRKKCPQCKAPLRSVKLHVVDGDCWKCKSPMKVAFTSCDGMMEGPPDFDADIVGIARKRGAILRERYSKVVKERYLANSCPRCGNFVGEFYLHDFWYLAGESNDVDAGYQCSECAWHGFR